MAKRRELTGNRVVRKGNPVRERIVRAKRREVEAAVQAMVDGPKRVAPFRGRSLGDLSI